MKIARMSLLLLLVAVVVISGCKAAQPEAPVADSSDQVVDSGLEELDEIDSLAEETDLGLEELEQIELE
ncbi:MAG: hypothetical protein AABX31_00810 [Nanoarchaeota archaeon]